MIPSARDLIAYRMKVSTILCIAVLLLLCCSLATAEMPRILVEYGGKNAAYNSDYTKLAGAALASGAILTRTAEASNIKGIVAFDCNDLGNFSWQLAPGSAMRWYSFARSGGRVAVFYTRCTALKNEELAELYSISVASEVVMKSEALIVDAGRISPKLWSGLRIGSKKTFGKQGQGGVGISGFLMGNTDQGENLKIRSESSGRDRVISLSLKTGKGEILFLPLVCDLHSGSCRSEGWFFDDRQIDLLDNQLAMERLFKWLAGN